ncbi:Oidioi.mRNA.OKI2018_I69.chr1.g53.t1.cds [Oikopleura dioica]|uniref:Oidioi.mRNA.OKI2018_I69.chr1.g53.t1.cds n=1 Tax=Oikopleura dioica TaxID=34765 RepID=A0ABN7SJ46_OIKDI|nr:Oidioi.mRNA.OKI2018_I69.chr1.g53.t1.cds [Oikopleura dioica]
MGKVAPADSGEKEEAEIPTPSGTGYGQDLPGYAMPPGYSEPPPAYSLAPQENPYLHSQAAPSSIMPPPAPPSPLPPQPAPSPTLQPVIINVQQNAPQMQSAPARSPIPEKQPELGHDSVFCKCPICGYQGMSSIEKSIGGYTFLIFIILLVFVWPISWIAFCAPSLKDTTHYCAACNQQLGFTYASGATK